jgi:hypothetical protein
MSDEIAPHDEEYIDEQDPQVKGPWLPATITDVDWALSRIADCEREVDDIRAQLKRATDLLCRRAEELEARIRRGAEFFRMKLLVWAEQNPDAIRQGKKKSRDFLHGRIGTRSAGGHLKVTDKRALEGWLAQQPIDKGLYRIKIEAEMIQLQHHFQATGEVPPGTEYESEAEKVYIRAESPTEALALTKRK